MIRHFWPVALALASAAPAAAGPDDTPSPRAVAKRFLADYAAERLAPMAAYVAPEAEMRIPFSPTGPMVLRGTQATAYLQSLFARYTSIVLSDVTITPAADDRTVFVEAKATYTDRQGATHSTGNVWAIEVERGVIVRSRSYTVPA